MKQFTRFFIFIFFFTLLYQSCIIDMRSIRGNGKVVHKEIVIPDYQEIAISGDANVIYEQQTVREPYLQLCVDENILPLIEVQVNEGKLIIKPKDNQRIRPSQFTVYTNSMNLNKARLSGSGELHLKGEVNSKDLNIDLSGSGDIVSDSLYCQRIQLILSGSGNVNLKGASTESLFQVSGSGTIRAMNFFVQNLTCEMNGSGKIQAIADKTLKAMINGSGSIEYKGSPLLETKVRGSGSIKNIR